MFTVLDYFQAPDPELWLRQIGESDWRAGQYLHSLLRDDRFHERYGARSRVLLLTEGERLLAFCTYAERDEIADPSLTPWAGFVYTFPEARGKRRMGKLLEHAYRLAKADGHSYLYLSTDHTGLYEKYGFTFWRTMAAQNGEETRVYRLPVDRRDYSAVLGTRVRGVIDRPLGSAHPRYPDHVYPVNYGYVEGVLGGDGMEQDVYLLGPDRPLETFEGTVAAVVHRLNDREDKWIVSPDGRSFTEEEIRRAIDFQEQYYMGEICLPCISSTQKES